LKGGAAFDFNIEMPSWKNKLLDFIGYLNFDSLAVEHDTVLEVKSLDGRIKIQQQVDFRELNFKALAGTPKINLVPRGDFSENPIKLVNYREMNALYSSGKTYQKELFIPRLQVRSGKDYVFDSIGMELSYENNTFNISHIEMKTFGGTMTGRARVECPDGRIYLMDSLLAHLDYSLACQINGINFDWIQRGFQAHDYYRGRKYEIDFIFNLAGRDLSDLNNLNISGSVIMPFTGPRIAKTFFRTYIDPQNKMKVLSTINSFLSRGAHIENVHFAIANGRFGINMDFSCPFCKFEVPRRNPLSNVMEMITLQLKS
jgi:hypothetical protein